MVVGLVDEMVACLVEYWAEKSAEHLAYLQAGCWDVLLVEQTADLMAAPKAFRMVACLAASMAVQRAVLRACSWAVYWAALWVVAKVACLAAWKAAMKEIQQVARWVASMAAVQVVRKVARLAALKAAETAALMAECLVEMWANYSSVWR